MQITSRWFGNMPDGRPVHIFTLKNSHGMKAEITQYGGTVVSLYVPDKDGNLADVVLGFDDLDGYLGGCPYFGAVIGRHANRIEGAEFVLNGVHYALAKNEGENHLHGGDLGFDKVLWDTQVIEEDQNAALRLTYISTDGEEHYPGNLEVAVTYTLTEDNRLKINYRAVSDKDTVVNLTNHTYFNLAGHGSGDIVNHEIMIDADQFTAIDSYGIPTGEISSVDGTPLNLRAPTLIAQGIEADDKQIRFGKGYDHNWVLKGAGNLEAKAAVLYEPDSGRILSVYTTKPGLQFYSGNFLDGTVTGKQGVVYGHRNGLCLETQYFPNAMKHAHFPSPVLKAGEVYDHTTIYEFSAQ